ncbi:hypothetical protein SALBM135S_09506 [Streptomyces alboniger]
MLESSIFQAGSIQSVDPVPPPLSRVSRTCGAKRSVVSHSHGYSLKQPRMKRSLLSTKRRERRSQPMSSMEMDSVARPACSAVSLRYATVIRSSPSSSAAEWAKYSGPPGGSSAACFRQASTRRSCREFHWSAPGKRSSIQNHCGLAASTREVGVSALYSSILAGPVPS